MAESNGLCYLLALAVSAAFIVYGFVLLLQKERPTENDVQVIQRQIRGFAMIMLAQVILVLGMALCFGMSGGAQTIRNAIKSLQI
jgi:hypothetical protein